MSRLQDGVYLCLFERAVVALEEGSPPRILPATARTELATAGAPTESNATLCKALADLDERYVGWLPGFLESHREALATVEAMHSRRPFFALPRLTPPTLPASTLRRAQVILKHEPARVFLADDPDCLSVLLAPHTEVTVFEPDPLRWQWLRAEAERAGCNKRLYLATENDHPQSFDISVIYAGSLEISRQQLSLALELTRAGGRIVAGFKLPWEESFMDLARTTGLKVLEYHREIDQWLVPGPTVIDGGQDLAVFDRPAKPTSPAPASSPAECIRLVPHGHLDLDSLDTSRFDSQALDRFADLVAATASVPEEGRTLEHLKDHDVLCWYDQHGNGFTAELRRAEAHLLVTLVPFDPALEYIVLFAASALFGDSCTRVRPLRTRRLDKETFLD